MTYAPKSPASYLLALALMGAVAACGEKEIEQPFVAIEGAAIDGSEDADLEADKPLVAEAAATGEAMADPIEVEPDTETPAETAPAEEEAEPEGPIDMSFWDLALEELDADAMLDVFLFPEEWSEDEREELGFPPDIVDLVGRDISLEGFVIPGDIIEGNLRDFMLVRDLQACCFGGTPRPDEWIDVVMEEASAAEYHEFLPVTVTGTFSIGGEQDQTGKALGVFKMLGHSLVAED
jgi:hypothetical protein